MKRRGIEEKEAALALIIVIGLLFLIAVSEQPNQVQGSQKIILTQLTNIQYILFNNPSSLTNCGLSLTNDFICSQLIGGIDTFIINGKTSAIKLTSNTITIVGNILTSDSSWSIGTSSNRFANMVANNFNVYHAFGDANPSAQLTDGVLALGAGGSSLININLVNWFNGAAYFRATGNGVATLLAVLDTSGTSVVDTATSAGISIYSDVNKGEAFTFQASRHNAYYFNIVAGTGSLYHLLFQMGGTNVFAISTTGIENTQGLQSIIATALTNGAGTTTISLPKAEPDTTYAVTCNSNFDDGGLWITGKTTNQFVINTHNNSGVSSTADCIVVHQ